MKTILHKADTRGHADHGWLNAHHSFSFASWHNPERVHFGVLRVLNDDAVAPGMGFSRHPHDNMEIITIPLEGALEHQDNMGNRAVMRAGDVQVMSAGTGVEHSERNASHTDGLKLLQIWLFPRERNVEPRYQQITLDASEREGKLQQILSPDANDAGVWIHQDAWFHLGRLKAGQAAEYALKKAGNGVYAFIIEGTATVAGEKLEKRDGLGIEDAETFSITADTDAEILLMEVPMG